MTDINDLAEELYANARAKGFYDHEDGLRVKQALDSTGVFTKTLLAEHFGNRLLLIAGEAVEAHEELRSGRGVAELYFSGDVNGDSEYPVASYDQTMLLKPEGVLAELADIAIRTLETMASILELASDEEKAKLRAQVPQNEATAFRSGEGLDPKTNYPPIEMEQVNVGEVIVLKHEFNQSRAKFHGGRKF